MTGACRWDGEIYGQVKMRRGCEMEDRGGKVIKGEELDERTSSENIRKQLISHVSIFRFRLSFKSIHLVHIYSQLDSTPHYMT